MHPPATPRSLALRLHTATGLKGRAVPSAPRYESRELRTRRRVQTRAAASPPDSSTATPQSEETLRASRDVGTSALNRQILGKFSQSMEGDYRVLVGGDSRRAGQLPKDCLLFHCPDQADLAARVVDVSGGNVELGEIQWK